MSKNKDPAVLFYTSDFLSGTRLMNYAQIGKYITLLCLQHQEGHLSEEDLLNVCERCDEKVLSKFSKDENGYYYNKRMDEECQKRKRYSESRRKNVTHRYEKTKSNDTYDDTYVPTYVVHMGNENINENININEDISINNNISNADSYFDQKMIKKNDDDQKNDDSYFNKFWSSYPRKVGKAYAKKCFDKLKPSAKLLERMLTAIEEQKKSVEWKKDNGQYIPNPSTWINQGRWEDELSTSPTDHGYTSEQRRAMEEENKRTMDTWFGKEN